MISLDQARPGPCHQDARMHSDQDRKRLTIHMVGNSENAELLHVPTAAALYAEALAELRHQSS